MHSVAHVNLPYLLQSSLAPVHNSHLAQAVPLNAGSKSGNERARPVAGGIENWSTVFKNAASAAQNSTKERNTSTHKKQSILWSTANKNASFTVWQLPLHFTHVYTSCRSIRSHLHFLSPVQDIIITWLLCCTSLMAHEDLV